MARKNTEDAIQRAIIRWIRNALNGVSVIPIRNEDMRSRSGEIERGHPDLILETVGPDNVCYILKLELKTKAGKLSPIQKKWAEGMQYSHNRIVRTAYGFDEAKFVILTWLGPIQGENTDHSSTTQKP